MKLAHSLLFLAAINTASAQFSDPRSEKWGELVQEVHAAPGTGVSPAFWDRWDQELGAELANPDLPTYVRAVTTAMSDRSFHREADQAFTSAYQRAPGLKRSWEFMAEWFDVLNLIGKPAEVLLHLSSTMGDAIPSTGQMRFAFARSIAFRDLHRMPESQKELDRAYTLAKRLNHTAMLEIIRDLRSPGHSMDESGKHIAKEESIPKGKSIMPTIGTISVVLGVLLLALRFRR